MLRRTVIGSQARGLDLIGADPITVGLYCTLGLVSNLEAWERADRLHQLVQAVENSQLNSSEKTASLEWAKAKINLLDPTESGLRELLDLDIDLEPYFNGYLTWNKVREDWCSTGSD